MVDMAVRVGRVLLQNPVMPASGTFSEALGKVINVNKLGALVLKTITSEFRSGNMLPRVAETAEGMLNSIGIPSAGVDDFLDKTLPLYEGTVPPVIVSISAPSVDGFGRLAKRLVRPGVAAIEANISCPNIEDDGQSFAMHAKSTEEVVRHIRSEIDLPLWVKLTPNCNDIATIARAAENAGADAVVVANTILGMAIDVETFRPRLGNVMGGLSGPAIKPIILRQTYQCAQAVDIPVIGCGGIETGHDAAEYMLAGARAVQVGTASFINSRALLNVIEGLRDLCIRKKIKHVTSLIGALSQGSLA